MKLKILELTGVDKVEPYVVKDLSDFVADEYLKVVKDLESKTVKELSDFAKSKGLKKLRGLDKEALIKRILE